MDKPYSLAQEIVRVANRGGGDLFLDFEEFNRREVPPWVTRDLNTTTAAGGAFLVTEKVPDVLDALRPVSLLGRLPIQVISGLQGMVKLPRVSAGTTGTTAVETTTVSEADPTFGAGASAQPLRLATNVKYSRQLLAQAGGQGLSQIIKNDIARGLAQQLDQQMISGSNAGGATGQATGILNQVSGATVDANFTFGGAQTSGSWTVYLAAQKNMEALFVQPGAWLVGPVTAQKTRALLRGSGQALFLVDPGHDGLEYIGKFPMIITPYLATVENVILGQWNLVHVLVWGNGIEITVDPYSAAATGEISVTGNLMWNFCVRHPAAVAVSTDSGAQ